jgi:hypothetical protein
MKGECYSTNIILVSTSFIFVIPLTFTLYNQQWLASSACTFILITSVAHHWKKRQETLLLDKVACYYLGAVSLLYAVKYEILYIVLPFTIYTLIIYYYGYLTKSMVWCEDNREATLWHSTIHIFVALSAAYGSYLVNKAPLRME